MCPKPVDEISRYLYDTRHHPDSFCPGFPGVFCWDDGTFVNGANGIFDRNIDSLSELYHVAVASRLNHFPIFLDDGGPDNRVVGIFFKILFIGHAESQNDMSSRLDFHRNAGGDWMMAGIRTGVSDYFVVLCVLMK